MNKAEYTLMTVAGDQTLDAPWRTPFLPASGDLMKLPSGHRGDDGIWEQFKVNIVVHFHNRTEVWVEPYVDLEDGQIRDIFSDCLEFYGNTVEG